MGSCAFMIAANLPLTVRRGITFEQMIFHCLDNDHTAVDLTGFTAEGQVRKSIDSHEIFYDLSPTITNEAQGEITFPSIAAEVTAELHLGIYYWDFVLVGPDSRLGPYISGTFTIKNIVTKL